MTPVFKYVPQGVSCLHYEGMLYRFSNEDEYIDDVIYNDCHLDGYPVSLLSLVSSEGGVELGLHIGDSFLAYDMRGVTVADICIRIQTYGNFLKCYKRKGVIGSTAYRQIIFIYIENVDLSGVKTMLGLK